MLLVCIRSYLNSVLGYKCLILDTYHPDTLYLRERIRGYLEKAKGVREEESLGCATLAYITCWMYLRQLQ